VCTGAYFMASHNPFLKTHYFPFLWMAFFLLVDPIAYFARGSSLMLRLGKGTLLLLIVSIPFWLFFESLNSIFSLWVNRGGSAGGLSQILYGISHASILPSFFALLYLLCPSLECFKPKRCLGHGWMWFWVGISMALLTLLFCFPRALYPVIWLFLFFFFDALNWRAGNISILYALRNLKIKPLFALFLTGVLLGLYWEGLNVLAQSAWSYHLPYFGRYDLFQMPLLGYLGYAAFGGNIVAFSVWVLSLLPGAQKYSL